MKRNLKKRFRSLLLAAGLASLGCNTMYAGLWETAGSVLGVVTIGAFIQGQWRVVDQLMDKVHLMFGSRPKDVGHTGEWLTLERAYKAKNTSPANYNDALKAFNLAHRRGWF